MATHHGTEGEVYNGANKIAEVNDWNLDIEAAFEEDTPGDETDATFHATAIKRWSGTVNCWYDETDTNGQEAIQAGNSVTLNLRPGGTGSGKPQFSGTARITGESVNKPKPGIVERRFTFQGSGALSRAAQ